jgi:hypothetical protein
MVNKQKVRRRQNVIARDLRTPKYRQRIVKSKKTYDRKLYDNVYNLHPYVHSKIS